MTSCGGGGQEVTKHLVLGRNICPASKGVVCMHHLLCIAIANLTEAGHSQKNATQDMPASPLFRKRSEMLQSVFRKRTRC